MTTFMRIPTSRFAQLFATSKSCVATVFPSTAITTWYLPTGHRLGLRISKVVIAGPVVAIDWLVLTIYRAWLSRYVQVALSVALSVMPCVSTAA